jgi:sugar O-acyltransferase (sialic acid O-acetyltransferase NeuD family)
VSLTRVVILGAGGQAREIAWYLEAINRTEPTFALVGFLGRDPPLVAPRDGTERYLGDDSWLDSHSDDIDGVILGMGSPEARVRAARALSNKFPRLGWPSVVFPSAQFDRASVKMGHGTLLGAGVVATVNVEIGDFALLNFGCTVGHETRIGRGSVINPGANVSGGVTIGEGVLVGAGAVVLQYRSIGDAATIGAGAVVTKDVAAGETVVGVPARPAPPRRRAE